MRRSLPLLLVVLALTACRSTRVGEGGLPVRVVFEGQVTITARALDKAISEDLDRFAEQGFRQADLDDAAYGVELTYRQRGFPFTEVEYSMERGEQEVVVLFSIREGPRTQIAEIHFEGNEELDDGELQRFFERRQGGSLSTGTLYYVETEIREGARGIATLYVALGYLDAEVDRPVVEFDETRENVTVSVVVREGPLYRLTDLEIGGEQLGEELRAVLEPIARAPIGKAFSPRTPFEIQGRLDELLAGHGHPDERIELESEIDETTGTVVLRYRIDPGPRVTVSEVRYEGNERTRKKFMEARMKIGPGDVYDVNRVRESVNRLYATGVFDRVVIDLEGDGSEQRPLVVRVEERRSLEFWIEPGYGTYELFRVQAGASIRNLFGRGQRLTGQGTLGVLAQGVTLSLIEPSLFLSDYSSNLTGGYERREFPSFTSEDYGIGYFVGREWTKKWRSNFGYQFRHSQVTEVDDLTLEVLAALDNVDISSFLGSQHYDGRDNFIAPRSGQSGAFSLEVGDEVIGSEMNFVRTTFTANTYHTVFGRTVLAAGYRMGVIFPINGQRTIPLQERFFNGGPNSVRSFRQDRLGPRDSQGNFVGGEVFNTLNVELRQPLLGKVGGAFFVDAGNVLRDFENFGFSDLRPAVGAGLHYMLPIGPLRLDVGVNPDARGEEATALVQFAVGMAF